MALQSGHEGKPLEGAELERYMKNWEGQKEGMVRLTPGRWLLPTRYLNFADRLYNFKYRKSDVVILSFPKTGTTWTEEIVWTMLNNPDLNNPKGKKSIFLRCPAVYTDIMVPPAKPGDPILKSPMIQEMFNMYPIENPYDSFGLKFTEATPDPRVIKNHLPLSLNTPSMLDTCKVVYVTRNPKDVIISFFHQCKMLKAYGFVGSFTEFVDDFIEDNVVYSPFWLHMKEAWEKKAHPNLHILFFEDLKANPLEELKKLNVFLDTKLTESQLETIREYTSFSEMKKRNEIKMAQAEDLEFINTDVLEKEGGFFRKGNAGDWKGKLSPDLDAKVDQWIQKNIPSPDLKNRYGL